MMKPTLVLIITNQGALQYEEWTGEAAPKERMMDIVRGEIR